MYKLVLCLWPGTQRRQAEWKLTECPLEPTKVGSSRFVGGRKKGARLCSGQFPSICWKYELSGTVSTPTGGGGGLGSQSAFSWTIKTFIVSTKEVENTSQQNRAGRGRARLVAELVSLSFISHANEIRVKQRPSHEMGANNTSNTVIIDADTSKLYIVWESTMCQYWTYYKTVLPPNHWFNL